MTPYVDGPAKHLGAVDGRDVEARGGVAGVGEPWDEVLRAGLGCGLAL